MSRGHGSKLAYILRRLRRLLLALSLLILGALAGGCFVGRDLYLVEESPLAQDITTSDAGGGAPKRADGGANHPADDGGQDAYATTPDATTPIDAGPIKDPSKPTCAGGAQNESEPNGTLALAKPLLLGKTCGTLALAETDWFTMDMGISGNLRVTFEADGDARLLIQSAGGGVALATGSGGAFNFATNGRWNLRVVSDTGRAQAYALVRP